jgi:Mu-like prophage I protein
MSVKITHVLAFANPQPINTAGGVEFSPPSEIVWMPAGETMISAGGGADGEGFLGTVLCDAQGAADIQASYEEARASGLRVWLDFNHEDNEASADIRGFRFDPARGIVAQVEWTKVGASALADKTYYSFSPAFLIDRESKRPVSLIQGHAAGGLVNAPAFGARMPSLIAARLSLSASAPDAEYKPKQTSNMSTSANAATAATADSGAAPVKAADTSSDLSKVVAMITDLATKVDNLNKKEDAEKTEDVAAKHKPVSAPIAPEVVEAKRAPVANVVTASLVDTLKAYGAEKDPVKRGRIFARDFSPRYKKDFTSREVAEVLAANSLGSLAGDLIAQQALSLLKFEFPVLNRITTDFSSLGAQYNQTIKTRTRSVPSVGTYSEADGYVATSATTADVSVTINNHKFVEVPFSANELASTARDLFTEQMEGMHYALGKDMVDALYALMLVGNYSNTTTQASSSVLARQDIQLAKAALNKRGVPQKIRTLLVNSDALATLFSDTGILNLAAYQKPAIIEQGVIANVAGFDIVEAPNLVTTGNQTAFGFSPDALVLATRVPNDYTTALPGSSYGNVSVITNPDTGLSLQSVQYVNHQTGKANLRYAVMYGVAVGQASSGQRIKSS